MFLGKNSGFMSLIGDFDGINLSKGNLVITNACTKLDW